MWTCGHGSRVRGCAGQSCAAVITHQRLGVTQDRPASTDYLSACLAPSHHGPLVVLLGERVHSARTVRTVWGVYPAFTPQLDPHKTAAHSNIGTQKHPIASTATVTS